MSSFKKVASVAIAIVTLVWAVGGVMPTAQAATAEELQAQIAALLAQINALQSQLGTPTTQTSSYNFTRDLTLGARGDDVSALQQILISGGYLNIASPTGYFGALTKAALGAYQAAKGITPSAGYFGPKTRAYMATSGGTVTPPPVTPPVTGAMTVSLATDNPASANVQRGSANNTVLKLVLTGGSTAVSVTGLTLKSYGTTEATGSADVSSVKLYDENGVQLGNSRTPAGNAVNFVIVPALTIPANGSRTVTVTATIGSSATVMAIARYGLESATSILGGNTFSGTYPLLGSSFTIVPAGQLGSVSVSKFGTLPKTSVKVGEKDIVFQRFNVSAGSNEDIQVNQIVLTGDTETAVDAMTHTISDADVNNLRIRKVGDTAILAGPAVLSNKKVTFNLTSPISLTKGASINLDVLGDIVGDTGVVGLEVLAGGVVARGTTSGTNISSTGSANEATGVTIGYETLTVSMSSSHPQGANALIISTTNKKDLAKFDVKANGGSVILNTINVNFDITDVGGANDTLNGTTYLSSVGLYDGDSLISDLITVDDESDQSFSLNYTIDANTTKTLTVKGITNTLSFTTSATLATYWSGYSGYGLASGTSLTSTANVTTTNITVYPSGLITPSDETDATRTMHAQAILAPLNNVPIGAVKLYAQREDMKLTDWIVYVVGTNLDDGADISSVTLYDQDGTTQLSDAKVYDTQTGDAIDTFTFASSDFLNDIIITKGTYRTLIVKANINSTADTNAVVGLFVRVEDTAAVMKFIGQDSGTVYDNATSMGADLDLSISSPFAGGNFSFDKDILEVKKASTSPSGSVSRGTYATYAVWDVSNVSSDQTAFDIDSVQFTSKTGLPSGILDADNSASGDLLFALYDGDGTLLAGGATFGETAVVQASGTVTFTKADLLTVNAGEPKQLVLKISTTNTALWPSSTQMQWSLEEVGDLTSTVGKPGYGGTTWSIPAVTNVITLP